MSEENFHEIIQESINAMVEWGYKLLGFPNGDNCKVLFLENSNWNHPYKMSNDSPLKTLEITKCEKDLGVHIDFDLDFNEYIKIIIEKARNICYMIIRVIAYRCIAWYYTASVPILDPYLSTKNQYEAPIH